MNNLTLLKYLPLLQNLPLLNDLTLLNNLALLNYLSCLNNLPSLTSQLDTLIRLRACLGNDNLTSLPPLIYLDDLALRLSLSLLLDKALPLLLKLLLPLKMILLLLLTGKRVTSSISQLSLNLWKVLRKYYSYHRALLIVHNEAHK